ncbi:cobalt-precorrin-6A reductase [uncultured Dietzia sp.]|uniref:cobalt-precorrin-6A reductase n=1 Tax=uncultured Dietzia sp. TaxID=395519 RepID=UPI002621919C|nr:cobalt-precorrin-6A reductase [uncultured Dietzia sp.]
MTPARPPGAGNVTVHLVGVGPGPVDLLTVRATRLITRCGTCLHESGAIAPEVLALCPATARVVGTSGVSPAEVMGEVRGAHARGDRVVLLLPGDPSQHPAADEVTRALDAEGSSWDLVPGLPATPGADPAPVTPPDPDPASAASRAPAPAPAPAPTERPTPAPMPSAAPGRILVLGGTGEADRLADLMVTAGLDVVTSLAGKVARPRLPRGEVGIGDVGGPEGLASWLRANDVSAVIDATHPFATDVSDVARRAAREVGTPLLRVLRPPWEPRDGDEWIRVADTAAAARCVRERFRRPMLTVGRRGAVAFSGDTRGSYLIRCAEPPTGPLPHRYLLMLDRGPFGVDSERTIMARHRIDVLVARNSGGESTAATLQAARELRIPVVMVDRPEATPGTDTVTSVDDAALWLVRRFGSR